LTFGVSILTHVIVEKMDPAPALLYKIVKDELLCETSTIKEQLDTRSEFVRYNSKRGWSLDTKKDFWKTIDELRLNYRSARMQAWDAGRLLDARQHIYVVVVMEWTSIDSKIFWQWEDCKKYIQELIPDAVITQSQCNYATPGFHNQSL